MTQHIATQLDTSGSVVGLATYRASKPDSYQQCLQRQFSPIVSYLATNMRVVLLALMLVHLPSSSQAFEFSNLDGCRMVANCSTGTPNAPETSHADTNPNEIQAEILNTKVVIFATNRQRSGASHQKQLYKISTDFNDDIDDNLHFGFVEELYDLKSRKIIINSAYYEIMESELILFKYIKSKYPLSQHNFIFVHGVNNSFESAITAASYISDFATNEIIPIDFIWPSRTFGLNKPRDYNHDKSLNEESLPAFVEFFHRVALFADQRADILAHSRGCYLVSRFLDREMDEGNLEGRLRSVSFAAPDISARVFTDLLRKVLPSGKFIISLYKNRKDLAIKSSEIVNVTKDIQNRLGIDIGSLIDIIDVEGNMLKSPLGHDFFVTNKNVAEDYKEFIRTGRRADRRKLLKKSKISTFEYTLRQ